MSDTSPSSMRLPELVRRLSEATITPKILASLTMCALLASLVFLDQTAQPRQALSKGIETLTTRIAAIQALELTDGGSDMAEQVETMLAGFDSGLLAESTKGLNSARLQSAVSAALKKCKISNVYLDIDDQPLGEGAYLVYTVSVRARDRERNFPSCLRTLAQIDVALVIESIDWARSNGVLRMTAKTLGRQDS